MDQEPKLTGAPKETRDPQIIIVREKADGADYKLIAIVALLLASPVILFFGLPFMAVAFVTMESWLPFFLVGLLAVPANQVNPLYTDKGQFFYFSIQTGALLKAGVHESLSTLALIKTFDSG
ncbi:MAG: hypothetical protein HY986_22765 [Candidatus Melainabacteria bacterium]|nr:hypothetical protein [Candidatus Melainabacteria bacterium]